MNETDYFIGLEIKEVLICSMCQNYIVKPEKCTRNNFIEFAIAKGWTTSLIDYNQFGGDYHADNYCPDCSAINDLNKYEHEHNTILS